MEKQKQKLSELLTMTETMAIIGVARTTLYKMVAEGRIPVVKVTRLNMFDPVALEKWIKQKSKMPIKDINT